MKRKTFISVFFAVILLGFSAYLDSPYSFLNKNYAYSNDQPAAAVPIAVEPSTDVPDTEERLVKREKKNGYIFETYEEYEVYKDKDGHILKSEPTGQTDTLKYWDYSKSKGISKKDR
ncbi:hypothetical protein COJ85_03085 [Bacillus sp. AFS076308]|uniref:hypothetical protein n=1 Tax=unclassified Bacillus (in: firmicutes) TaxID=185979 RepID=UPI000BF3A06F|nr:MULTISPECIES: hypothetical protein [unclassified Bacillus (in: firmicutes)]PFO08490.1 hypothetical protein COJ85_03085 [Bacillus sp. AFS076308]PGV54697.1 hypothetical protein COD92_04035 [Bacillus sp. AFS037270]